jgi:hypothetical protein
MGSGGGGISGGKMAESKKNQIGKVVVLYVFRFVAIKPLYQKDTTVQIFYPNFLTVFEEALIQSQLIFYACVTGQSLSFILQAGVLKKWQLIKRSKAPSKR